MRNVIVTGGSRGIGLSICERLAASGYRAIAVARKESDELSKAIAAASPGVISYAPFDLDRIEDMPQFVKDLRKQYGPVYGLVNNAGIGTEGLLAVMPLSEIEKLIRIFCALDLRGQEAAPHRLAEIAEAFTQLRPGEPLQKLADLIPGARPHAHPELRLYEDYRRYLLKNPIRKNAADVFPFLTLK